MGLIKAAVGAATGVMAEQWKEYFYCEAMPSDVLAVKGMKKISFKSGNLFGDENIITNGSAIAVADGQCMMIVEDGRVVDYCAEPGVFTYDSSSEPSLFDDGKLSGNARRVFENMTKRFAFGGEAARDQRIYYFNTREMTGCKYGTANPIPFRVVDERAGLDVDISVKCFGEYSIRLTNPVLFYTNVCGNFSGVYRRAELDAQMKSEFLTALQPAFAKISAQGVRYSEVPAHASALADAMNDELSAKWRDLRGIEIVSCGISSLTAGEEDVKMIKEMQRNAAFLDPAKAAAYMVGYTGSAMQAAAENANGAAAGFLGMNAAQTAGGINAQNLYGMAAVQKTPAAPASDTWACTCGAVCTGNFCSNCGAKRPEASWTCSCGAVNTGNFCSNCGKARE